MYVPEAFRENDPHWLRRFIERHPFGTLITTSGDRPIVTRLPLLCDDQDGLPQRLFGHLARPNPQWQACDGRVAVAQFDGPHAYVSASWYEAADTVPTWNYESVSVHGTLRTFDDPERLATELRRLAERFEGLHSEPWRFDSVSPPKIASLLRGIVGIELQVTEVIGKRKLGQNHPHERRRKTIAALHRTGDHASIEVAERMQAVLDEELS